MIFIASKNVRCAIVLETTRLDFMTFDLTTLDFQQNPYQFYTKMRQQSPLVNIAANNSFYSKSWLVTRYADVLTVLKDPRFTVERRKVTNKDLAKQWWVPGIFRAFLNSMVMVDDPDHARLRTLVHKAFTPRMVQELGGRIEEISNHLLDQMAGKERVDLMADFALPLPITVISEMMGIPQHERQHFHHMMAKFLDGGGSRWAMAGQFLNGFQLHRFFKRMIALHRRSPQDDLISALVKTEEEGDKLSEAELVAMLLLLLLAGHETTVNLIGNGTLALLEHPDQFEKLKANPDLLESAIEEMLRFTNPVQQIAPRYTLEDVELQGQHIPKGSTILVGIASANRDEEVFAQADHFDITRHPNPHVAFGLGIHYCLGAPLARLEGKIAFAALLHRYPNLKLALPSSELKWRGAPSLRGLRQLPICLK